MTRSVWWVICIITSERLRACSGIVSLYTGMANAGKVTAGLKSTVKRYQEAEPTRH